MPGMYERDATLKVLNLGDTIFNVESKDTPFTRLLRRGKKPDGMLSEWPVEKYRREGLGGTLDGTDKTAYAKTDRKPMKAYAQWFRSEGYMVSRLMQLTATAAVSVGKEKANQATKDAISLAKKIERALLSILDTQTESGADPFQIRGALMWLQSAAQTNNPVPDGFRPGTEFAAALSTLTPTLFETLLEQAADEREGAVDLLGVVGIKLKRRMSTWAQRDTEAAATDQALASFDMKASDKKLIQVVDVFEFDAGMVKTIPSWNLACDVTTGNATAYTSRSGIFVDPSMWELCWLDAPGTYENPDLGGGPRGWHEAVGLLKCLNALGQFRAYTNT